jgi:adenosylhomocysteine nucleosidase
LALVDSVATPAGIAAASIGIVAALESEARTLGSTTRHADRLLRLRDGMRLAVSGIGSDAAGRAARSLADAGATALVSWGMAGALDPSLRAGQLILPSAVIGPDGTRIPTSVDWRARLGSALRKQLAVSDGLLLTSPAPIDSVAGKSAAWRTTQAVAVDMESLAVAQVAAARALSFIAVRVIVDTAVDLLPQAVIAASRVGQVQLWRLMRELALAPGDVAALLRLAGRYRAARRTLLFVARAGLAGPQIRTAQLA